MSDVRLCELRLCPVMRRVRAECVRRVLALILAWITLAGGAIARMPETAPPDDSAAASESAEPGRKSGSQTPRREDPREDPEHWLRKLARLTITSPEPHDHSRNHPTVLAAFRDVVKLPSMCTVRVFCGGKQVACGTIVDADGLILTKGSELDGPVVCLLSDGTRHPADLVGTDRDSDLALLKINVRNLPTIRWSQGEPPTVGGWVVTPGAEDLPQAIGIVSVAAHRVRGGMLGVQLTEDDPGPRIVNVVPQSGAATAGLRPNDVVTHVNDKPVKDAESLIASTSGSLPGDAIKLTILRRGVQQEVTAVLGSVTDTISSRRARFQEQLGGELSKRRFLFPSAMEHDSILEPNQCGTPLLDLNGEAVGINIARATRIATYAIPSSVVRPIVESLKSRALLNVSLEPQTTSEPASIAPGR